MPRSPLLRICFILPPFIQLVRLFRWFRSRRTLRSPPDCLWFLEGKDSMDRSMHGRLQIEKRKIWIDIIDFFERLRPDPKSYAIIPRQPAYLPLKIDMLRLSLDA